MRSRVLSAAGVVLGLLAAPLGAQEKPVAFVGARVIPAVGPEIPKGVVVVHKGKVVAVGAEGSVSIPGDAVRREVSGKVLMPGLVDTHSHIGGVQGADSSAPIQPDVRAIDAINVADSAIQKAQAAGITTVNVMPGSGHLLSGQTAYLKLRDAKTIDALLLTTEKGVTGGMKMANGTNSRRQPPFPGTRAKSASLVREQYVKAQEYKKKLADGAADPKKAPGRDLAMEALVEVLDGKRIVHFHTHRQDDILTAMRLAEEFGFRVVLQHVSDAWKVAPQIAASKQVVGSSIIVIDAPGGKLETADVAMTNGAALEKVGAPFGFHTDDGIVDSRFFRREAALAIRNGLSRGKAVEALTIAGARMLDLSSRVGSLEKGKDADLVILSGDPFSVYTNVLETWVEGQKVFDRADPKDRLYAVGGFGASHDSQGLHLHEADEDMEEGR
ncbi:MAG: amidohydrolase family protein [Vicinamibacteria bacterium]|nr:amidohydrolase family protein [Vicinamibacteria bacterium]